MRPVNFVWNDHLAEYVTAVAWSPQEFRLALTSAGGELSVFDGKTGAPYWHEKSAHPDGADAVSWSPSGKLIATAGQDGKARIWNVAEKKQVAEIAAGAAWAEQARWGAALLAIGAGNKVTLCDEAGEVKGQLVFTKIISDLTWINAGKTLAVATSSDISIYDAPLSGEPTTVYPSKSPVLNMAFSPNGRWLMAATQDRAVHVWSLEAKHELHMAGYPAKARDFAWHKGGRWFATNGVFQDVLVWDCAGRGPEGRHPAMLKWHTGNVSALHYQPVGDLLASGDKDGGVSVWNPTLRNPQLSAAKISSGVSCLAWSPEQEYLAITGEEGDVQVITLD